MGQGGARFDHRSTQQFIFFKIELLCHLGFCRALVRLDSGGQLEFFSKVSSMVGASLWYSHDSDGGDSGDRWIISISADVSFRHG